MGHPLILLLLVIISCAIAFLPRMPYAPFINKYSQRNCQNIPTFEVVNRVYVPDDPNLVSLQDCNNYYSGKFGRFSWHQNSDQVVVTYPLMDNITKDHIKIKFDVSNLTIQILSDENINIVLPDKIIPDGSFWTFENCVNQTFLQLDMEKRFRAINWRHLFSPLPDSESKEHQKLDILKKLFEANQGMSKLTGSQPESMEEMMANKDLMDAIDPNRSEEGPTIDFNDMIPIDGNGAMPMDTATGDREENVIDV